MDEHINSIFNIYNDSVRPLLVDIQIRNKNNKLPDNFLNEIRALNDHIARCYREGVTSDEINRELTKADGHLRRLIYDCFKQLNIYLSDILEYKEKKYFSDLWISYKKGNFWTEYSQYRKQAQLNVIEAKKNETINTEKALQLYENAFINYRNAENLLLDNKKMLCKSIFYRYLDMTGGIVKFVLITLVLSIISSVIGLVI
jgi:hypothetical protein